MRTMLHGNGRSGLTRRAVLRVAAAVAAPYIVPASVFGQDAPSNRINIGVIGCGSKAHGSVSNFVNRCGCHIAAVCDPNDHATARYAGDFEVPAERCFRDYRQLLALKDVDAVLIATPDHWHVPIALAAARAGKDMYCEKPLSNCVAEGQLLVSAVREHKVVFQHGTQLKSHAANRRVCELVRNGYLGDVRKVTIGSPPGHATGDHPAQPVPGTIDWDLWQGPAPVRDYRDIIVGHIPGVGLRGWYFVSDYSLAGWIAGFGVHDIDLAQWGLGTELTGPVSVEGQGVFPTSGLFDTVLTYSLTFTYADGRQIVMTDTGQNEHGVRFHGDNDRWLFCRSGMKASHPEEFAKIRLKDSDTHLYASGMHESNFIECVKSRKDPITPIEVAHRSTSTCLIGGICLKLGGGKLTWDPQAQRFVGNDNANALLTYKMREPYNVL